MHGVEHAALALVPALATLAAQQVPQRVVGREGHAVDIDEGLSERAVVERRAPSRVGAAASALRRDAVGDVAHRGVHLEPAVAGRDRAHAHLVPVPPAIGVEGAEHHGRRLDPAGDDVLARDRIRGT